MMESCKDTVHQCSRCGRQLATVSPSAKCRVSHQAKAQIELDRQRELQILEKNQTVGETGQTAQTTMVQGQGEGLTEKSQYS